MKPGAELSERIRNSGLIKLAGRIGGDWRDRAMTGETFHVTNPSTGERIASLPDFGEGEAVEAVNAAFEAFQEWKARTAKERSSVLRRLYDLLNENAEDLASIITLEMGKPVKEARAEVAYGASYVEWFAEEAKRIYGDVIPASRRDVRISVIKQPVGVVGAITPWNFPLAMLARKLAPALAVGCTVVAKPAEQTPLSALALAALMEEAGAPPGVFNVLPTTHAAVMGAFFCNSEKIRKISFTGSTEVGKILIRNSADTVKRLSMELGGNAPFIVFDDADIDAAVQGAIDAKFRNAGQTCVCANRIYVHSKVRKAFELRFSEAVSSLRVGDGFETGVNVGPLIDRKALEKVETHMRDALDKGAEVIAGGERLRDEGLFYAPTALSGATHDMLCAREETFGPIAPIFEFSSDDELIERANGTRAGLAAYFYAGDVARVFRTMERLDFGMVGVNTGIISNEAAPFGGVKESGFGREGSKYGVDDYLDLKYAAIGGVV